MRRFSAVIVVGVLLASCSSISDPGFRARGIGSGFNAAGISFSASLTPFSACDAVLDYFKTEAMERVGPYGLDGGDMHPPWVFEDAARLAGDGAPATTMAGSSAGFDSGSHSTTNVQVAGVDEPDIVKSDTTRIISVIDGVLRFVDLTGDEPRLASSLRLDGWGHTLLADGDRVLVLSPEYGWAVPMDDLARTVMPAGSPSVRVIAIDVSNPDQLVVESSLVLSGSLVSARATDGTVRVVVSSYPGELGFVYPSSPSGERRALEANRQVIADSTIEQWLPSYAALDAGGSTVATGLAVPCNRMHKPADFGGFSTLSVVSLDMDGALAGGTGTGIIAAGDTVYASAENLYVSTTVWVPSEVASTEPASDLGERYSTAIHQFAITGAGAARYVASGSVAGHLLDQFSMDEHDGRLRVAVTDGPPWWFSDDSESLVVVLEERDGVLTQVASVGDMGRGERIFSVRFMGDTAYVVTFRQTDPFYVVDLSDPTTPTVVGELKIDGYSGYLHPIGEDLILGVGQDADSQGVTLGAKATIFDVSDPSNPREVATWVAPGAYTDAEWDHHAFLAWAPADIVVLPVQEYSRSEPFAGVVVLDTADGLAEVGRISHQRSTVGSSDCAQIEPEGWFDDAAVVQVCDEDDVGGLSGSWCEPIPIEDFTKEFDLPNVFGRADRIEVCWPGEVGDPLISRSLVVGDTLWTLSGASLQANGLSDLALEHRIAFDG